MVGGVPRFGVLVFIVLIVPENTAFIKPCRKTNLSSSHCYCCSWWPLSDSAVSALQQTRCARISFYITWLAFYSAFWNIHRSGILTALFVTWLVPRETAAISARCVYIIQPCTISRHFMQSHICRVHAFLVVTCHLHFWQNERGLLRATAVTRGTQKVDPGEENCPAAPVGTRTRDFLITSPALLSSLLPAALSATIYLSS